MESAFLARLFRRHLAAENYSPRTQRRYLDDLRLLVDFVLDHGMPADPLLVRREHMQAFVEDQLARWKPRTAQTRYQSLQAYFVWLVGEEQLTESPMAKMHPPKVPKQPVEMPDLTDIRKLLDTCKGSGFRERRDRAIITLFFDGGLRREELASLQLTEVDLDHYTLWIRDAAKGGSHRQLGIGKKAARELDRYLLVRKSHADAYRPDLWLGLRGPLTGDGVYQIITKRAEQAGLKIHPHALRHSWADSFLAQGGQETDLMRLAGWASRSMVERYGAARAQARAIDAHRRLSPGDTL